MKVKSESEVAQSCPTLSDLIDCSLPGSSIHGIFQARVLELGAIAFSDECFYLRAKKHLLATTLLPPKEGLRDTQSITGHNHLTASKASDGITPGETAGLGKVAISDVGE